MDFRINRKTSEFPDEKAHEAFLTLAADWMYESVIRNFGAGGRPSPWAIKRDGMPSHLIESGRLISSIRTEVDPIRGRASVFIPRHAVPYDFAHQFGYAPNHLPARPYMLWQEEDRMRILDAYKGFIISFMQTQKKETNA